MNGEPRDAELDRCIANALTQIQCQPDNGDVWHTLGQCLLRNNMFKAAQSAIKRSLQLALQEKVSAHYDPIFSQELLLTTIDNRLELIAKLCHGSKVLHVGCSDYPLFNAATNLHLQLYEHGNCSRLDGFDIDEAGLAELNRRAPGKYFSHISQVTENYDLLLVPETIEHVDNIQMFLAELSTISFRHCLITAPYAFLPNDNGNYWTAAGAYIEHVHPDHTCWFSAATLQACIRKFTDWQVDELFLLDYRHMVGCLCSRRGNKQ